MSIAIEEGNGDEKSKPPTPHVDELGITKYRSIVSSVISVTEKDNKDEVFDPSSCRECRLLMERKNKLSKQNIELKQTFLKHGQLEHGLQVGETNAETNAEKPVSRDSPRDILQIFNKIKYTGNLSPLSNRLPDYKAIQNGAQPPMPGVKRLKGDLAKSVGNKVDGCDWFMFHPYVDISLPEELNKDGGLKQA